MRPPTRLLFAVLILAGVTAGCSGQRDKGATAVTPKLTTAATSTTDTSPTSSAPAAVPVTPAPPTTVTVTELPTTTTTGTTAAPTTVTRPAGQSTPTLAATGLMTAWQAGDRAAAATYADPPAIKTMFTITREPVQAAGPCQQDGATFSCPYFAKSGNVFYLRSAGSAATGYRIAHVTTSSD